MIDPSQREKNWAPNSALCERKLKFVYELTMIYSNVIIVVQMIRRKFMRKLQFAIKV